MSDDSQQAPIIIKKIKGGHGGHHGGAWKVAFADFMTAMMAFFLVMWLVGQKPEVRESVAGFFRDPGKYQMQGSSGFFKGSQGIIPSKKAALGKKIAEIKKKTSGPSELEIKKLNDAASSIISELAKLSEFNRLKKNIKIQMTSEGLRIILNESANSPAFFEPGCAKLLQESAIILMTIARQLGTIKNRLVIEGHTDASYGGNSDYTNWELSADRANSARQLLEVSGLYEGQVREVRGFADQFPMIINNANDPRNRRVSIVVLYKSREGAYDQLEVGADLLQEATSG